MNYKFMLTNFVNKQISYFFPPRCFLELIKFRPMNNKFMLTNFVNEQISYFFPPRCFLVLMRFYRKKVTFYHLNVFNASQCLLVLFGAFQCLLVLFNAFWCFLIPFSAFQCLFVLVKSYRKKKQTGLITSFILLLLYHCTKNHIFFFTCSEKMFFRKNLNWNMIFLVLSGKMTFLFSQKYDLIL